MTDDELFMVRALELAANGKYTSAPNPRVGAVIVYKGQIIGEGYHQHYGEHHAEVNAVHSVADKSLLKKSKLFVTLEPCSHYGKTPPCTKLIIDHQIPEVIIANSDPFAKVDGKGIQLLKEQGVKVKTGVLEKEGFELNRRFFTFHQEKRPYILLKFAKTKDNYLVRAEGDRHLGNWISGNRAKELVHLWRAEEQAIMVGKNTAMNDNPNLTCRDVKGKNPIRIILDPDLDLPSSLHIFNQEVKTIILNKKTDKFEKNTRWVKMRMDKDLINEINAFCFKEQVTSLLVEGGAMLLSQFLTTNNWDEARIFTGPQLFHKGIKAPEIKGTPIYQKRVDVDELAIYRNRR